MRRATPPERRWLEPIRDRLERAAGDINPFLIVIVIGLAILVLSVFMALELPRLPLR
jgi:hypothetical protein